MVNDWDRHQGQWKWARTRARSVTPRGFPSRATATRRFISYGGALPGHGAHGASQPDEVSTALSQQCAGSPGTACPSIAGCSPGSTGPSLIRSRVPRGHAITDSVIDAAVRWPSPRNTSRPAPQLARGPQGAARLAAASPRAASTSFWPPYVDIHASDMTEHATVTRRGRRHGRGAAAVRRWDAHLSAAVRPRPKPGRFASTSMAGTTPRSSPATSAPASRSDHRRQWHQPAARLVARRRFHPGDAPL